MPNEQDLFGKTYDQQIDAVGGNIEARDITPNRRIPAEILFEPTGSRIRVTAYDANNHVLFQRDVSKKEVGVATGRLKGEVVFEPVESGVRVTARDEDHKVLWGYVGSKETVRQVHCLVAIYDTFQTTLADELEKRGLISPEEVDPIEEAKRVLHELQGTLDKLRDCILVQKREDATDCRARHIARIASDANKMIDLELSALGPLPQVSKDRAIEIAGNRCIASTTVFADGSPPKEWDKKKRDEWTKKCWFISATTKGDKAVSTSPRLVGIGRRNGAVLYDSNEGSGSE